MKIPTIRIRFSLLTQIILLISIVVIISMLLVSALYSMLIDNLVDQSLGQEAMLVAKLAATDNDIITAFKDPDPSKAIQPIAESVRMATGAGYVVIGDKNGNRLSHPKPELIGLPMGTSNDPVFKEHQSVIYRGTGVSGPALKAKTPIYDKKGEIIGVSSVGFLLEDVEKKHKQYQIKIIELSLLLLVLGVAGAYLIARRVKRLFFGFEPEEISFLFKEKEATIESIRDGIIALDTEARIISMNKKARELFVDDVEKLKERIKNPRLQEIFKFVINTGEGQKNQNVLIGHQVYIMDSSPILQDGQVGGVVLTLRNISEIDQLVNEVSKIKTFSENMRAQNHEFLNKLNTIYGLLCLEQYNKAMEIISSEVRERQDVIAFLMSSVKDPLIAAVLLGKVNRSKELKVALEIDQESNLEKPSIDTTNLVTILGNVIDNAMEAALEKNGALAKVKVSFTDMGREIIFDIEDNGVGIKKEDEALLFQEGFSTKSSDNRGIGLAIVKNSLELLHGEIFIDASALGGARFTIVIPKS